MCVFMCMHMCIFALLLFSCPVMSISATTWLQHARLSCPSPSPKICPSSYQLHQWSYPAISPSDTLFFCSQSLPASRTFPVSWLFELDNQNTRASASGLPASIQGWFFLRLTGLIFLLSKGLSGVFSSTTVWRHEFFGLLPSFWFIPHKVELNQRNYWQ